MFLIQPLGACFFNLFPFIYNEKLNFHKIHKSTFQQIEGISIFIFTTQMTSICEKKINRRKAFSCFYKILSFNEIGTAEAETTQEKYV